MQFTTKLRTALVAVAASAGVVALAAPGARAQFSTLTPPSQTEGTGTASSSTTVAGGAAGRTGSYSINLFPYAPFQQGFKIRNLTVNGTNVGDVGDKITTNGILIAPEAAFANKNGRGGYGIGAWYWARTDRSDDKAGTDLFDVHGKYYFNNNIGVQLGYLGNVNVSDSAVKQQGVNLYATYNYQRAPQTISRSGGGGFGVNVGLGVQQIASTAELSDGVFLSGFAAASYDATRNFTVNLSYWFWSGSQDFKLESLGLAGVGGKVGVDFNLSRFGLGLGYKF